MAGVERGEGTATSLVEVVSFLMAAFVAIVMVAYVILKLTGEGNEDVLNLNWIAGVGLAFWKQGRGEWEGWGDL